MATSTGTGVGVGVAVAVGVGVGLAVTTGGSANYAEHLLAYLHKFMTSYQGLEEEK